MENLLNAYYIGSDYTYAYSQKFRDTIFRDNTVDENLLVGVTPIPVPSRVRPTHDSLPNNDESDNS